MSQNTQLSFEIVELNNCKLLGIVDSSQYSDLMLITGNTLQVIAPGYRITKELSYAQNGVTILNTNTLGLTKVGRHSDLPDLPDGLYTAKISICPYDQYWYEKQWYRTCVIECKYSKAILLLDLNPCTTCYDRNTAEQLDTARRYIEGCKANVVDKNFKGATELYGVANNILDSILECKCGGEHEKKTVRW